MFTFIAVPSVSLGSSRTVSGLRCHPLVLQNRAVFEDKRSSRDKRGLRSILRSATRATRWLCCCLLAGGIVLIVTLWLVLVRLRLVLAPVARRLRRRVVPRLLRTVVPVVPIVEDARPNVRVSPNKREPPEPVRDDHVIVKMAIAAVTPSIWGAEWRTRYRTRSHIHTFGNLRSSCWEW
jgi:hypothetical protein